jgi:hypothetical protein
MPKLRFPPIFGPQFSQLLRFLHDQFTDQAQLFAVAALSLSGKLNDFGAQLLFSTHATAIAFEAAEADPAPLLAVTSQLIDDPLSPATMSYVSALVPIAVDPRFQA